MLNESLRSICVNGVGSPVGVAFGSPVEGPVSNPGVVFEDVLT